MIGHTLEIDPNPSDRFLYNVSHQWAPVLLNPLCRPRVYHPERIPRRGRLLIAVNHASYLDPIIIGAVMPREIYYMAKSTLFWGPIGRFLRLYNALPVKRGEPDIGAMKQALRVLRDEKGLLIFPEGTRGTGEELLAARRGVGFLATRAEAPVLPVYMDGMAKVWGRGQRWIRRAQVEVFIGEPMAVGRRDDPEEVSKNVLQAIADLRAQMGEIRLDCPRTLG